MASPTFVEAGVGAASATSGASLSCTLPTGWTDDDIHVLLVWWKDSATAPTLPSGYTEWTALQTRNAAIFNSNTYYRRAVAGDASASVAMDPATTTLRAARVYGYRGCIATGDPSDVSSALANTVASATINTTNINTTVAETLVAFLEAYEDDPSVRSLPSGYTASGTVYTSSLASDTSSSGHHKALSSTGAENPSTVVSVGTFTNSPSAGILIALKAPVAGAPAAVPRSTPYPQLLAH